MARIKKDQTKWGVPRLFEKAFVTSPEEMPHRNRKNVRKWCKGKVGKKHEYKKIKESDWGWFYHTQWKCKKCGRLVWGKPNENN